MNRYSNSWRRFCRVPWNFFKNSGINLVDIVEKSPIATTGEISRAMSFKVTVHSGQQHSTRSTWLQVEIEDGVGAR